MANQEMFDRVLARIVDDPEAFDMHHWFAKFSCGTTACIAGHTVLEAGWQPSRLREGTVTGWCEKNGLKKTVNHVAMELLGLDWQQAVDLFSPTEIEGEEHVPTTPEEVSMRWKAVTNG